MRSRIVDPMSPVCVRYGRKGSKRRKCIKKEIRIEIPASERLVLSASARRSLFRQLVRSYPDLTVRWGEVSKGADGLGFIISEEG